MPRSMLKLVMTTLRWFLGALILLLDALFPPRPLPRSPEEKLQVDQAASRLSLYQFQACPFCVKVRRAIRRLNVTIELRDALKNETFAKDLLQKGGKRQVPCLRVDSEDGSAHWLYESKAIIGYLERSFPFGQPPNLSS